MFTVVTGASFATAVESPAGRPDADVVPAQAGQPEPTYCHPRKETVDALPRALIRLVVDGERALLRRDHPAALAAPSSPPA
jgi:hypothetical protein